MDDACPQGTVAYIVRYGDTLYSIADLFRVSAMDILNANPGICPNCLYLNQTLCIPVHMQSQPIPTPYMNDSVYQNDPADPPQNQGPPSSPPPNFTPGFPENNLFAVDPGALARCTFSFVYLWLNNGQSFWAYLVYVGRTSAAGWRYQRGRWVYFGIDLDEIRAFTCY